MEARVYLIKMSLHTSGLQKVAGPGTGWAVGQRAKAQHFRQARIQEQLASLHSRLPGAAGFKPEELSPVGRIGPAEHRPPVSRVAEAIAAQKAKALPAANALVPGAAKQLIRGGLGSLGAATAVGAVTLPVSIAASLMYAASRKKQNFTGEPLSLHEEAWSRSPLANQVVNPGMEALKPG